VSECKDLLTRVTVRSKQAVLPVKRHATVVPFHGTHERVVPNRRRQLAQKGLLRKRRFSQVDPTFLLMKQ
jgi:hypothetical protein